MAVNPVTGEFKKIRLLFDNFSQHSYVTECLCNMLRLRSECRLKSALPLCCISLSSLKTRHTATAALDNLELCAAEMNEAKLIWIKAIQSVQFNQGLISLQAKHEKPTHTVNQFALFIDLVKIIRC